MAMSDYFYKCNKIESKIVSDGLGGFETVEYIGIEFDGLVVRKGSNEQLVGALRGSEQVQYTFHCPANVPLVKDDKIRYSVGGEYRYIRLSSDGILNAAQSDQTDWKTYNAESYIPAKTI